MSLERSVVSYHNHDGTLSVYRGYFPKKAGAMWLERVRESLTWSKHTIHGNHDRLTWDGKKIQPDEKPGIINQIGQIVKKALGNVEIGSEQFANCYESGENRTFWHRDYNLNPNESVVMVSFGAARTLTFVDYRTDEEYPIILGDGDIVVFDFKWNFHTFHAVERSAEAVGERISLQFFHARDAQKWTQSQLDEWSRTEQLKKRAIIRRRIKVNKQIEDAIAASSGTKRKRS
jgi:alkylated DNA repair dioxygenase AlkB